MKRFFVFALPVLATLVAIGLAFLFIRSQSGAMAPRIATIRKAVGEAIEEVAEQVAEQVGEALE
jgi:hypothetical protein